MYDKATNAEIINSLGGFSGTNYMDKMDKLPEELQIDFFKELEERLKSQDYDSEAVVKDSLENASKDYFTGMNYNLKRGIERYFDSYGKEETLERYAERADEFKTANYEEIEEYVEMLDIMDKIEFYF